MVGWGGEGWGCIYKKEEDEGDWKCLLKTDGGTEIKGMDAHAQRELSIFKETVKNNRQVLHRRRR